MKRCESGDCLLEEGHNDPHSQIWWPFTSAEQWTEEAIQAREGKRPMLAPTEEWVRELADAIEDRYVQRVKDDSIP